VTKTARGFTLLEVVVALAILGVSLAVLLESQASSLNNAGRSRDMTVATLLARAKMIDIEKQLFHDGFAMNTEESDGDFRDEGHAEVTWKARVSEVELDLTALTSICGGLSKKPGGNTEANDCENMLGGIGGTLGNFTEELGRSMRVADLKVSWPEGKYKHSMSVRALLTKDDYTTAVENAVKQNALDQMRNAATPPTPGTQPVAPGTR
jgi:type II secretion system protein I